MLAKLEGFLHRKVAGVPMSVILLIGAALLAVVAYRAKKNSVDTAATDADSTAGGEVSGTANPIFLADPSGTSDVSDATATVDPQTSWTQSAIQKLVSSGVSVTDATNAIQDYESGSALTPAEQSLVNYAVGAVGIAPTTPPSSTGTTPVTADTNDAWSSEAVQYLVSLGTDASTASAAIQKYLSGGVLSYNEGRLRDQAVNKFGIPPVALAPSTTETYNGPAVAQGVPPLSHVVRGTSDNTPAELAQLYYGSSSALATAAIKNGGDSRSTYNVGDSIPVPAYSQAPLPAGISNPTVVQDTTGSLVQFANTTTATASATPATTVVLQISANQSWASFVNDMKTQRGFTISSGQALALNPDPTKSAVITAAVNNAKHASANLRIN